MDSNKILKIAGIAAVGVVLLFVANMVVRPIGSVGQKSSGNFAMSLNDLDFGGAMEEMAAMDGAPAAGMPPKMAPQASRSAGTYTAADTAGGNSAAIDKKIIRTGSLSLKVEKAETAAETIRNIARLQGGDVYSSNFSETSRGVRSGYLTVRIPFANFDKTFSAVKDAATQVLNESTNAQDITEEYIDLEARLNNKLAEEVSFAALLNRTGKIEEVLSVTRELARVRGEIEQLEGRKRYLDSQTDMSTISVHLSEDVEIAPVGEDWRPWQVIKASVKELLLNGQRFADGSIRFVIVGLPILLIYVFVIWILFLIGRRVYRHYSKKVESIK